MNKEDMLKNTTILFSDIDKYRPKICIVKHRDENGLYHLETSRNLDEQEIFRTFFGLAKYLKGQDTLSISNGKETLSFKFSSSEVSKNENN